MISEKRKRFCHEYVVDFNGRQAAIRSGYSEKTATGQASMILDDPIVQKYLQKLLAKQEAKIEVTAQRVIDELASLAFHDIGNYYKRNKRGRLVLKELDELTESQRSAVSEYDPKKKILKLYCKDPSLDKLGKYLKLFSEFGANTLNFTMMESVTKDGAAFTFNVGLPKK